MQFPERFSNLPAYAFPRLRALLDGHAGGAPVLNMSIGEPQHPFPEWVVSDIAAEGAGFGRYPANDGTPELRAAICGWVARRYGVTLDPEREVMALNGTREGLFNAGLALIPELKGGARPVVLMPNPFYQVYAVAAAATGAEPHFLPCTRDTGHLPDLDALSPALLDRAAAFYLCSPANPQGAVADEAYWRKLLSLAERHDFRVFADECYAEIWRAAPPPGALEIAAAMGLSRGRVVVFHSLSKRSSLPGLRSGFVASGPEEIAAMKKLRAYAGAPLPGPVQAVSARLWADDAHAEANRRLYDAKFALADSILADVPGYESPPAGFFLWLSVGDGEAAALRLWRERGLRVLPGAYLARAVEGVNPGAGFVRVALVAPAEDVSRGLVALRETLFDGDV